MIISDPFVEHIICLIVVANVACYKIVSKYSDPDCNNILLLILFPLDGFYLIISISYKVVQHNS